MSYWEPEPTRWWRVLDAQGNLWCETSNEAEARRSMRDGDRLERLYVTSNYVWKEEE